MKRTKTYEFFLKEGCLISDSYDSPEQEKITYDVWEDQIRLASWSIWSPLVDDFVPQDMSHLTTIYSSKVEEFYALINKHIDERSC